VGCLPLGGAPAAAVDETGKRCNAAGREANTRGWRPWCSEREDDGSAGLPLYLLAGVLLLMLWRILEAASSAAVVG